MSGRETRNYFKFLEEYRLVGRRYLAESMGPIYLQELDDMTGQYDGLEFINVTYLCLCSPRC